MSTVTRVESHIFKNNKELDKFCFDSKNLYNSGLYLVKQSLQTNNKWLSFNNLDKLLKNHETHKALPAQVAYVKSVLKKTNNKHWSKRLSILTLRRN